MKKRMFVVALACAVLVLNLSSCSKKNDLKKDEVVIDEKDLTSCPLTGICQNLYSESADLDPVQIYLKSGSYRVFWSETKYPDLTSVLYIKAPLSGNSFTLSKADVLNGRVQVSRSCAACYMIAMSTVDGFVKGVNLDPDKPQDQRKWLIEAKVIRAAVSNPSYRDTIYVKQRFSPNFAID